MRRKGRRGNKKIRRDKTSKDVIPGSLTWSFPHTGQFLPLLPGQKKRNTVKITVEQATLKIIMTCK